MMPGREDQPIKRVKKVWGEERWIVNKEYCGKILILKKGFRCSLHSHKEKDETFYLLSGKVFLELDGKGWVMEPGDKVHIRPGSLHRFTGLKRSQLLEFSTHHEDEDSYRIEPSGKVALDKDKREKGP